MKKKKLKKIQSHLIMHISIKLRQSIFYFIYVKVQNWGYIVGIAKDYLHLI